MSDLVVVLYRESDGSVPVLEWVGHLPKLPQAKCMKAIERLRTQGRDLPRPEADYLRDGIYELRIRFARVNYRLLYFFYGRRVVVVSQGLTKEREVPATEIDRAVCRKNQFEANPGPHSSRWRIDHGTERGFPRRIRMAL
ncbi:MAG: type II toxin-antitoxin system RelE/ParE family toxin [Thermodesulfobacteriota bacterium]